MSVGRREGWTRREQRRRTPSESRHASRARALGEAAINKPEILSPALDSKQLYAPVRPRKGCEIVYGLANSVTALCTHDRRISSRFPPSQPRSKSVGVWHGTHSSTHPHSEGSFVQHAHHKRLAPLLLQVQPHALQGVTRHRLFQRERHAIHTRTRAKKR